jgi:hypothetical protein
MVRILSNNGFACCMTLSLDERVHEYELAAKCEVVVNASRQWSSALHSNDGSVALPIKRREDRTIVAP